MSPESPSEELVPTAPAELLAHAADPPGQPGRPSLNYAQAIEIAKVLSASGFFLDARDPAKAAVKVLIGLDLGISPTAALQGIHTMEERGKTVFLLEGKLLASVVKSRPDTDYRFKDRTDQRVEVEFLRNGEPEGPNIVWDLDRAKSAGLAGKDNWKKYPREMLTWRALAEGIRAYFPDILGGQPVYAVEEFDKSSEDLRVSAALEAERPQPLTDEKAENLKTSARGLYDELKAINPERMVVGRFASLLKGAEHSHASLENVVASLEDLRETEKELSALEDEAIEKLGVDKAKPLIERAERRGNNRERIASLRDALSPEKPSEGSESPKEADGPQKGAESAGEGSK